MGLQDYTYRIKAQSGDTTIHDEKGVSADMSGGTQTLVDMGSGDYAWQIASGRASVAVPSKTFDPETTGGGVTIAVRLAITSYDASSFAFLVGWATDAAPTPTKGLCLGQNGTNVVRSRWIDAGPDTLSMLTVNNAVRTYVLRATSPASGLEKVHAWVSGVTGSGDTADYISPGQNYSAAVLDTVFLGTSGGTVRVSDFVIWPEELTDAQCHALAENGIRATLDTGGSVTGTSSITLGAVATSGAGIVVSGIVGTSSITLDSIATAGAGTVTGAGSITGSSSITLGSISSSAAGRIGATLTVGPFKNKSGTVLASQSIAHVVVLNPSSRAVALSLASQSTDGSGYLALSSADLVPGSSYMVASWNSDGSAAGNSKITAAV